MDGARLQHDDDLEASPQDSQTAGEALVGRVLERRYRLDRVIGSGAMGHVYRATHALIGKGLAVKVLRHEHVRDATVVQRFLQEARLASSIKHPNVVDISDFGELEEGAAYYVMELLEGRTLATLLDTQGALEPKLALSIALQIARGLGAAHAKGIVHRDLKPENVFLTDDPSDAAPYIVKLLDFGIARSAEQRITVAGAMLGTPEYMSPEQAQGLDVDARTDIYALGIIVFEMLTGLVPYGSEDVGDIIHQHIHATPPSLASVAPALKEHVELGRVTLGLLAKAPEDRPGSVEEALQALCGAMEADLGQDAADRVKRATLTIGSDSLRDLPDRPRAAGAMSWGARTGGTQLALDGPQTPEPPAGLVAPPAAESPAVVRPTPTPSSPGPAPRPTTDPVTSRARRASPPIVLIMGGAAVVASLTTFGLVAAMGGLSGPAPGRSTDRAAPEESAPSPAIQVQTTPVAVTPPAPNVERDPLPAVAGTTHPSSSDVGSTPTLPIKAARRNRSGAASRSVTDGSPSAPRTRSRRGKPRKSKPAPTEPTTSAPASDAPPPSAPADIPDKSKAGPQPDASPDDLKDPFSSN